MKYINCKFCDKQILCEEPYFLTKFNYGEATCHDCNASFYIENFCFGDLNIFLSILTANINNINYEIRLYKDKTFIYFLNKAIGFEYRLPLTPTNINNKLQMYLALI